MLRNNRQYGLRCWVILLSLLLGACSQSRYRIGEPVQDARFEPGTDLAVLLQELGPPHRMTSAAMGYLLAWESWRIGEDKVGVSLRPLGADLLSIDWGDARASGQFLLVSVDKQHRVIDSEFVSFDMDAGGGQGIQALISAVDVVDVDDLTNPMPQHHWGRFNLEELSVTLNRQSHIDSGYSGLEQRGTPVSVGQRSSELR